MIKQEKDYFNINTTPKISLASLEDRSLWQNALSGIEHSFYQTWDYCNAIYQSQKRPIELLRISDNENGLIITYCKRSKTPDFFDIFSPYGFGGIIYWGNDLKNIYLTLYDWLKSNSIVTAFLMAHPVFIPSGENYLEIHRSAFVIDLNKSIDELWQNLGDGHKYEIKKIKKEQNLVVTDNKDFLVNALPSLYNETITRVSASSSYHFSVSTLQELTLNDSTILLGAMIDNLVKAVIMVNYTQDCAEYFINASSKDGRRMTRLLLWEAILKLKLLAVKKFNLGGGALEGDQLEDFKKRMGGNKTPIYVYKKIINPEMYKKLCSKFCDNGIDTSYFPIYWKN